jgi:hypothetical protein
MNVNDSKVYTDCVEDIDTPLSDICFNEDLYTRPPTVEFTVVRQTGDKNKESSDPNSNTNSYNNIVNSTNSIVRNSSSNSMHSNNGNINNNISRNASHRDNLPSHSASHRDSVPNTYMTTNSRQLTPEDLNLPDSIWLNNRDRQVYVGQKGKAYYLSDNGNKTYLTNAPASVQLQLQGLQGRVFERGGGSAPGSGLGYGGPCPYSHDQERIINDNHKNNNNNRNFGNNNNNNNDNNNNKNDDYNDSHNNYNNNNNNNNNNDNNNNNNNNDNNEINYDNDENKSHIHSMSTNIRNIINEIDQKNHEKINENINSNSSSSKNRNISFDHDDDDNDNNNNNDHKDDDNVTDGNTVTAVTPAITTLKNTEIKSRKSPINGIKSPNIKEKNDVEIVPIIQIPIIKKPKKTIQMLFKKNDYKYCVENLYGKYTKFFDAYIYVFIYVYMYAYT